jgi:NDP-sugar pyrophosphorylase family protein
MKAMILAAGLGTRLRPLTNDRPKALVQVGSRTMLEITLDRLRAFGISEVIVNTHHYAERMQEYLEAHHNFGMHIEISHEEILLDTGGGLKKAAPFFLGPDGNLQEPFLVHNVDVLSNINLGRMLQFHQEQGALATLAVQERETSRYLLFDGDGQLCGRRAARALKTEDGRGEAGKAVAGTTESGKTDLVRPARQLSPLAFCGIHIVSPYLFEKMKEEGAFSIITTYLRLAAEGEKIVAFRADGYHWRDLGRPESVTQAALDMSNETAGAEI